MKLNDPRHGSPAGYQQHIRDGERACRPCLDGANSAAKVRRDNEEIALTGGEWQPGRHGILKWVPDADGTAPVRAEIDWHEIIACYSCRARADEGCRTKSGAPSFPHGGRMLPRVCSCGGALEPKRRRCDACVRETELESKRAWNRAHAEQQSAKRAARRRRSSDRQDEVAA